MKVKIVTIAIGLSFAISAAWGSQIKLNILEVQENLIARFNGAPASFVTITPISANHWLIGFTQGWTLNLPMSFDEEIGEPEGVPPSDMILENFITFGPGDRIDWESEFVNSGTPRPLVRVEGDLLLSPSGERFDIRIGDVPDGGSTVSLLGFALVALAGLRRKLSC